MYIYEDVIVKTCVYVCVKLLLLMVANQQAAHLMVRDAAARGPLQYQGHSQAVVYREERALLKPRLKKDMS